MKFLKKVIYSIWYFFWGHIFAWIFYDKKYLTGKWFTNKYFGLGCNGWKWAYYDGIARLFLGVNHGVHFPISFQSRAVNPEKIEFDPDTLNNFNTFGNYFQAPGGIKIGKETYIAPNVGIITANHDINDLGRWSTPKQVTIGSKCWIGMNSMILPGVILGDHTIVGAGSIVTKSFPEGNCVIAGNPAKKVKELDHV